MARTFCRFGFVFVCMLCGCSRVPEATWTLRTDVEKLDLPAKHARQIADSLEHFHGTPATPRMFLPAEDGAEPAPSEAIGATPMSIARADKPGYDRMRLHYGHAVYTKQCAACHGTTGDGKGPAGAHLNPPPRDYRNGVFKFTSTPRGSKPRRDDLRRILKYGAKGTSMPAFRFLSEEDTELYCVKCHGPDARGSKSADVGQDIWGRTAYPANLAMGMLHGGRRPIDIYRRIYSGINGTPMPSSKDPNSATGETPEQRSDRIWHLVHFVTAIIEDNDVPPAAREAIEEVLKKQAAPTAADEPAAKAASAPVDSTGTPLAAATPGSTGS